MANARNAVDYSGIDQTRVTFKYGNTITYDKAQTGGSASVGLAVTYTADDTVDLTTDASAVVGRLEIVDDDGFCTVCVEGFVQLPLGASATLTRGKRIVGCLGASSAKGYIRDVATATAAELGVANHQVVNVATSTAVWVKLG